MKQLTVNITREFTPEMERLRRGGFAGANLHENCSDEFDSCSLHVVTRIDHELAGLLRLTPNPPSVLQKWSGGKAPLPHGNGVVCLTRAVVQSKFQGLGLYKLMMLDAIRFMGDTSAKVAVGVIKPEDPWKNFLTRTGWTSVGEPIRSAHPEEGEILSQFIRRELYKHDDTITPPRLELVEKLKAAQFVVRSRLWAQWEGAHEGGKENSCCRDHPGVHPGDGTTPAHGVS